MPRITDNLGRLSLLLVLAILPALAGCSPKAPVKPDPAPQASITSHS